HRAHTPGVPFFQGSLRIPGRTGRISGRRSSMTRSHARRVEPIVLAALLTLSCSLLLAQTPPNPQPPAKPAAAAPAATAEPAAPPVAAGEQPAHVIVQHVLIGFEGSVPGKNITRTKEAARALAAEVYARAKKGEDFDALVKQY